MQNWKTTLTYDGTHFHGWQIQPGLATIQGLLAQAIHRITGETILPQGSGRTDAGVHALAQVATFPLVAPIPAANLHRALNHALPASIRVLAVEPVSPDFHARYSALRKTYEYRIFSGLKTAQCESRICSPMLAPFVWDCSLPLDLAKLQQAAAHVIGAHDFTSFAAADPDQASRNTGLEAPAHTTNIRTLFCSCWHQAEDLLCYRVTGSGFLHHMVRNLVGTFVEAATGRIAPDSLPAIVAARDRSAAGPTAPATGLFLLKVEY